MQEIDLTVQVGKMMLKNPVIVSSGTFGFGEEFQNFFDLNRLGGIVSKSISLKPMNGNPPPRIFETEGGILNSIGLQNPGYKEFVKKKLAYYKDLNTHLIVNFFGNTEKEYVELAGRLGGLPGVSGLEMNISCPNIKKDGIVFGTDPRMAYHLVRAVKKATRSTLIVKLSPNVTDVALIAKSVEEGGADAISMVNTFRAMAINIQTRKAELGNIIGGLSGPAIKPIAVRMVWEVHQAVSVPIIGMGGIMNSSDAIEFILVGASAIQIGTANLINPKTGIEVIHGIEKYLVQNKIASVQELIGAFG